MALMHKDVGEDLPAGILSSWSGHITSKHNLEHTDSDKVDSARMHVREHPRPWTSKWLGKTSPEEDRFEGIKHGR